MTEEYFTPRRCGQMPDGKIRPGACGKPYAEDYRYPVCDCCSIRWDIAHASLPGLRDKYADELVRLTRCAKEGATEGAYRAFPECRPKSRTPKEELSRPERGDDCTPY